MLKRSLCTLPSKLKMLNAIKTDNMQRYPMKQLKVNSSDESLNISFLYLDSKNNNKHLITITPKKDTVLNSTIDRIRKKINAKIGNNVNDSTTVEIYIGETKLLKENEVTTSEIFLNEENKYHLDIKGIKYLFSVNSPKVVNFALSSKYVVSGYPILPLKIEVMNGPIEKLTFSWYISELSFPMEGFNRNIRNFTYIKAYEGNCYVPTKNDIGKYLKVIGKFEGDEDVFGFQAYSKYVIRSGPVDCPYLARHKYTSEFSADDSLRIVNYNILAGIYSDTALARTTLFQHCSDMELSMHYRKHLIVEELLGYKGDILCLQEVDTSLFHRDLSTLLLMNNYSGVHCEKSTSEGVATFYRNDKLKLIENIRYYLIEELKKNPLFEEIYEVVKTKENLCKTLDALHTALQVTILEHETENKIIIVGNTHLYFKPESDNIRLLQSEICLTILRQVKTLYEAKNTDKNVSILVCGDFNSCPPDGIYRYYTTGFIDTDDVDWRSCPGEEIDSIKLSHNLQLESACGTPEYTTYALLFKGCIDYIYFENNKFEITKVVPLPSHEIVANSGEALPNLTFPSDHLALVADLKWLQ